MWELMKSYLGNDTQSIQRQIVNHVEYTLARTRFDFDNFGAYQAAALAVRDRLLESWNDTQQYHENNDSKRVYYFSLEFLMGRTFQNALVNSDLEGPFKEALMDMGYNLEELYEEETDAALGNGGLGRLAACFVDSLATLEIPAWDTVSDMSTEFSNRSLEMATKSKFQIFGLITETHGRLRDKISSTKLGSMVTLKSTKTDLPREQDGKVAKRLLQLLTIPQSQDSTPITLTT